MSNIGWLLSELFNPRAILDVLVVTLIIFWLLSVAEGTRALHVIRGIVILFALLIFVGWALDLSTLNWVLNRTWPGLVIAIPVIFAAELRRAFEQLGHTGDWLKLPFNHSAEETGLDVAVDEIVRASAQLSRLHYGALIVVERETGLQDFVGRGVQIDAILSRQLLINIFFPNSPLHDAAVIVRNTRILAASVVLPLTDNISATSNLGTRHRAAIGVTEEADAIAVVVSEETGQMSVAHSGRLIRNLDQDRLRRVLRTLLSLDQPRTRRQESSSIFPFSSRTTSGMGGQSKSTRQREASGLGKRKTG
jgi:uncharacterized protein (TIGR00159 family)